MQHNFTVLLYEWWNFIRKFKSFLLECASRMTSPLSCLLQNILQCMIQRNYFSRRGDIYSELSGTHAYNLSEHWSLRPYLFGDKFVTKRFYFSKDKFISSMKIDHENWSWKLILIVVFDWKRISFQNLY